MSDPNMRATMARLVSHIGDDRAMWDFAILAVQYAQLRAHRRGFQHIEAACQTYVQNMRAVSGLPSVKDEENGISGL